MFYMETWQENMTCCFFILAKLLTQTKLDEIDYLLKNFTVLNFLIYLLYSEEQEYE